MVQSESELIRELGEQRLDASSFQGQDGIGRPMSFRSSLFGRGRHMLWNRKEFMQSILFLFP